MHHEKPLSITFVAYTLETLGGTERALTLIANGLAERGHSVSVVTTWGQASRFPLHPQIRLHTLNRAKGSFKRTYLPGVRKLRAHLARHRPEIVIGVETSVMLLTLPAAAGLGLSCVGWEHFNFNTVFNRPRGSLNRWRLARRLTARFARAAVVLTRRDAELWRAALPDLRARVEVIANPLPFAEGASHPYDVSSRVVLAAGRLTEQKGFDLLLDAWARVEAEFPEWTLRIVGGDGEEEAALKAQALHAGLARVEFAGKVQDMRAEYAAAGVYCLSSRYEGLPMVLLECLAFGLPMVAFDCETGPGEIIQHGENGLLVPPADTRALAAALRSVMSDPELRLRMGAQSRASADRFGLREILTRWEDVLGNLGAATRPGPALTPSVNP